MKKGLLILLLTSPAYGGLITVTTNPVPPVSFEEKVIWLLNDLEQQMTNLKQEVETLSNAPVVNNNYIYINEKTSKNIPPENPVPAPKQNVEFKVDSVSTQILPPDNPWEIKNGDHYVSQL